MGHTGPDVEWLEESKMAICDQINIIIQGLWQKSCFCDPWGNFHPLSFLNSLSMPVFGAQSDQLDRFIFSEKGSLILGYFKISYFSRFD